MSGVHLDPLIHAPVRLRVCVILSTCDEAEFALLREETGVSDSVLSKQLRQLEEAGYVTVRKATVASRQRTWLALTPAGDRALRHYLRALARLTAAVPPSRR